MTGEWQPIDTAPKDGTHILIFEPSKSDYSSSIIYVVKWDNWQGREQWLEASGEEYSTFKPTHWMPLPVAPLSTPSEKQKLARLDTCLFKDRRVGDVAQFYFNPPDNHTHLSGYTRAASLHRVYLLKVINYIALQSAASIRIIPNQDINRKLVDCNRPIILRQLMPLDYEYCQLPEEEIEEHMLSTKQRDEQQRALEHKHRNSYSESFMGGIGGGIDYNKLKGQEWWVLP